MMWLVVNFCFDLNDEIINKEMMDIVYERKIIINSVWVIKEWDWLLRYFSVGKYCYWYVFLFKYLVWVMFCVNYWNGFRVLRELIVL